MDKGLRFNEGKIRHDLVPSYAQEQYAKVLTYGADKYTIKYLNIWEKIFFASNANRLEISIANQCVAVVTKNNSGKIILNIMNDKKETQNYGEKNIQSEKESWILLEERIQLKEKEIVSKNGIGHCESMISQKNLTSNCVMKVVKSAAQESFCTLTMTIPLGNLEESYVVNATTALDSWETMWKVLNERCRILKNKEINKYSGVRNWEKGMSWSSVLASLERHLQAIKRGEDYDRESLALHSAHIMCNAAFLTEYYKIYPQGDDRQHSYLRAPKIGLDIDEVLADWVGHWTKHHGQEVPETWNFDRKIKDKIETLKDNKDFWLSIPVKTSPNDIHFEPHCYITSRSIPQEWTEEWLDKNGFPTMPVYSIPFGASKVEIAKKSGIDWFVDDRYENFVELNNAGICTFLFDAPHNRRYNVGYKRIKNLSELAY